MAFVFSRPPSPHLSDPEPPISALPTADHDAAAKERFRLEILLDKEIIYLKGTGVDVEPARLSGHVALYLTESTSVKEITLQFRGKARLPVPAHESISLNPSPLTYIVCNHEWSFLEGEKKHSHTLKAGRHLFPFQLQLGGSLPSSIFTTAHGGASVAYKLRAHVSRPGFNHNLQSLTPVTIIRSFASEALEYQQTLEIENTWPEKLMYSIMIPHKAWAAGDTLTALTKFSPLAKGVGVLNINTSIHETIKIYGRTGYQEHTRIVASVKHEIVGGKAVEVHDSWNKSKTPGTPRTPGASAPPTPSVSASNRMASSGSYFALPPSTSPITSHSPVAEAGPSTTLQSDGLEHLDGDDDPGVTNADVVTFLTLPIPFTITPTHGLDPVIVTHRIRWSILILNLDGHTSELRCSLPLHLLDYHLLDEARSYTAATRRLLIGGPEVPPEEDDDMELPSYNAHVRDRVANMFLPESATMRVTNPWVQGGISPTVGPEGVSQWPRSHSGTSSPLEAHLLSHLPHAPGSGDSTPLDWVNSELLLSLSEDRPPELSRGSLAAAVSAAAIAAARQSPEHSPIESPSPSSRTDSRRHSRAPSPDRSTSLHVAGNSETYVHSGNASRNVGGVFKASMKPFTSITHPGWLSRSSNNIASLATHPSTLPLSQSQSASSIYGPRIQFPDPNSGTALLHRAFTEVPDYSMAARGFIGGVPPLSSSQGLPSYEETEQVDVAAAAAAAAPTARKPATPVTL